MSTHPVSWRSRRNPYRSVGEAVAVAALALCTAPPVSAAPPVVGPPPAWTAESGPVCRGSDGYAADFGGRRTFGWRPDWLMATKVRLGDPAVAPAYAALIRDADRALAGPAYTVVDKLRTPPSGDKHDYMSIGPYWWPDASKRDGLPYVRRDGRVNPERDGDAFDTADMDAMSSAVEALSLAYFFTDDARYARKAAELLRVWFLAPATRMNPNANFGQSVPGVTPGRAEGVLDTQRLLKVVESVGLLGPSGAIAPAEQEGLEAWFADYATWMATSPLGRAERAATNNHGLWFDYQLAAFTLFARLDDATRTVVAQNTRRIAAQVQPDGRLPEELKRTRSFHYSAFSLQAEANLANLGRCVGLDLWRFRTADGRSLKAALDFMAGYLPPERKWPYPEINREASVLYEPLTLAAWALGEPAYAGAPAPNSRLRLRLPAFTASSR